MHAATTAPMTLGALAKAALTVTLIKQPATEDLQARAAKNYPDNPYLQAEYIRAVGVVRATKGGWVMDLRPLPPVPARFQ